MSSSASLCTLIIYTLSFGHRKISDFSFFFFLFFFTDPAPTEISTLSLHDALPISRTEVGVDAHCAAVWGALKFVAGNRKAMLHDQIEIFRRGFLDLPQMLIPDELLDQTQWDQFNAMTVQIGRAHV